MLALYFGYLIVQLVFLASVKLPQGMDLSSIIFSVTVFVVWSFLPVVAYIGAKAIGAKGNLPKIILFGIGISAAVIEKLLLEFDILNNEQQMIGFSLVCITFFAIAYVRRAPKLAAQ